MPSSSLLRPTGNETDAEAEPDMGGLSTSAFPVISALEIALVGGEDVAEAESDKEGGLRSASPITSGLGIVLDGNNPFSIAR